MKLKTESERKKKKEIKKIDNNLKKKKKRSSRKYVEMNDEHKTYCSQNQSGIRSKQREKEREIGRRVRGCVCRKKTDSL